MFGIGMPELLVILVVALVVLGPQRLPELARTIGKAMAEFRRQTSEVMDEFHLRGVLDEPGPRKSAKSPPPQAPQATPGEPTPGESVARGDPGPEKPDPERA